MSAFSALGFLCVGSFVANLLHRRHGERFFYPPPFRWWERANAGFTIGFAVMFLAGFVLATAFLAAAFGFAVADNLYSIWFRSRNRMVWFGH